MFEKQIARLEDLISDWDNIAKGTPKHNWIVDLGICTNCQLGFGSLMELGYTYPQAKKFLAEVWKDFPGYTGDLYYPIGTKESYVVLMNMTDQPERLDLAKHVLNFLKEKDNGSKEL